MHDTTPIVDPDDPPFHRLLWVVAGVATCGCALWTWYQLKYFARAESPRVYLAVVLFSWWLGIVGVAVLLPLDLAISSSTQQLTNATVVSFDNALTTLWRIEYWLTFVLSWVVCPLLMEFWAAGEFSWRGKLWAACKSNLLFYGICTAVVIIIAVFVALSRHLGAQQLAGFLIAAANTYGMILIVVMIGNGLVELPRQFVRSSHHKLQLDTLYFKVATAEGLKIDSEGNLDDVVTELGAFLAACEHAPRVHASLHEIALSLEKTVPHKFVAKLRVAPRMAEHSLTQRTLAKIHYKLKKCVVAYDRMQYNWNLLLKHIESERSLLDQTALDDIYVSGTPNRFEKLVQGCGVKKVLFVLVAAVMVAFSLILLWCECTIPFSARLSVFGAILNAASSPVVVQISSVIMLAFIAACSYVSLFRFKLLDGLALHGNRQTDIYCLLYNASYLGRLQFSLGVHFLSMVYPDLRETTQFSEMMGDMDVVPFFGDSFNSYIPIVVVMLALMTYFRAVDKLLGMFGVDVHSEPQDTLDHQERIREGERIVENFYREERRRGGSEDPTTTPPEERSLVSRLKRSIKSLWRNTAHHEPSTYTHLNDQQQSSVALTEV